jgi:hypothetical protein
VFIGLILIIAVVGDIWLRQSNVLGIFFKRLLSRRSLVKGEVRA